MLVLCFGMSDDTWYQIWVLHGYMVNFQVSWMSRSGTWSHVSGIICVTGIPSTWYQVLAGVWYLVQRDRCQVSDIRSERNTWSDGSWGRDDFLDVQPPVSYLSQKKNTSDAAPWWYDISWFACLCVILCEEDHSGVAAGEQPVTKISWRLLVNPGQQRQQRQQRQQCQQRQPWPICP